MTINECGNIVPGYCSTKKPKIDINCHDLKKDTGDKILFEVNDITCYCICSCLGRGTLVTLDDRDSTIKVEDIVEKQTQVLAAGRDLKFVPQTVQVVSHSKEGRVDHAVYLRYTLAGKEREACVTMSHPFMLKNGTLVAAESLVLGAELVDRHGNAVPVDELKWGTYEGEFWEFSTVDGIPDPDLKNHLVVTNGVVTGDFAVEQFVYYRDPAYKGAMPAIIGSQEWIDANQFPLLEAHQESIRKVGNGYFTPASHSKVEVPPHASSFYPKVEALLLEKLAPKKPYNDALAREMCVYLLNILFKPAYPEITFHFDWFSREANSYSWVDSLDKSKHVLLQGGLARIEAFDIQAVALALAHEIGHLEGRPDVAPSSVTCEGEADWWGASIVLRRMWFGEDYFAQLKMAIAQIKATYAYFPLNANTLPKDAPLDSMGRQYPSHDCRISTFETAMHGVDQPECSKCCQP
ncbi:hypothetical protein [Serratia proteamaculans]|jgi:hypothetical protein|uniref:hypothetical protein n=1 Tax=Serratia proteamaculans TaxID=28151 RepID=UPI00217B5F3B|nr:hypothetical protein [Serratia proteamaculans]CAI1584017.1 Uncharacterised protein [Serratia proteamaculans]CAI2484813.1 Uncharacterised protein [Serratia proteamaculans]